MSWCIHRYIVESVRGDNGFAKVNEMRASQTHHHNFEVAILGTLPGSVWGSLESWASLARVTVEMVEGARETNLETSLNARNCIRLPEKRHETRSPLSLSLHWWTLKMQNGLCWMVAFALRSLQEEHGKARALGYRFCRSAIISTTLSGRR